MNNEQKLADFHIHTRHSFDAVLTIDDVEKCALENNVEWISITDHNTSQALVDLWRKRGEDFKCPYITLDSGIKVVSGVEVTARVMEIPILKGNTCKVQLLVFDADLSPQSPLMRLMDLKHHNDIDFDLRKLNYLISLDPKARIYEDDILNWCKEKGITTEEPSNKDIMNFIEEKNLDLGITSEKKLYQLLEKMPPVERLDLDATEVIKIAHASGGYVLMAHPCRNIRRTADKQELLKVLIEDGFETLYNGEDKETYDYIKRAVKRFSKKNKMIYSGGSDSHNMIEGNCIGKYIGGKHLTPIVAENLGIIDKMEQLKRFYEKGNRNYFVTTVEVENYIAECVIRAADIKANSKYRSSNKPKTKKQKNKEANYNKNLRNLYMGKYSLKDVCDVFEKN